jgi:hypothetical protein
VTSVLLYGAVIYACLGSIETTLDQRNVVFSSAETLARQMLRWTFGFEYDTRKSVMYVLAN